MNQEIIAPLVKNFTNMILTRVIFLFLFTLSGLVLGMLPDWIFSLFVVLAIIHISELKLVNMSFQEFFQNKNKIQPILNIADYVSISLSTCYVILIAVISAI